jgi:hypothetical protein
MKRIILIAALISVLPGCTKTEATRTSGIDTIDNTTHYSSTYFNYGFSFSKAKLISTIDGQGYDISLYVNTDNLPYRLTLQSNNLRSSFYKVNDFADETAAKTAFDNLKTFSVPQWQEMADPVNDNQVWIFRAGNGNYTKIRIVSTINETRQSVPYGECTFQWVYQPDGSSIFPGK